MLYNIPVYNNTIDQYDKLLSRFSNWKTYKREIKLNTLLESNKKIEFKVDIENHQFGGLYIDLIHHIDELGENYVSDIMLKNACAIIKSIIFIIDNFKVIELKIELKILETEKGNILSDMLKSDIDLEIFQKIFENEVLGFSFMMPKRAA